MTPFEKKNNVPLAHFVDFGNLPSITLKKQTKKVIPNRLQKSLQNVFFFRKTNTLNFL